MSRNENLVWFFVLTVGATLIPAQDAAKPAASTFSKDQLEQMVAPIALYPDPVVTQILMAATYGLEVVAADRWVASNKGMTGTTLDDALKTQTWDPSVKSLVKLPDVLKRMSDNVEWTQNLGDAFLGQKEDVLDAVQRMRGKANAAGNLKTTPQQTVTVQPDNIIVIEPVSSEIVYVPTYSTVVYGSGWDYPTSYYPSLYPAGYGALAFGTGVAVGAALWGGCHWGWGHSDVNIDADHYNNFNRFTSNNVAELHGGVQSWQHNPVHRQGVAYKDGGAARRYGGAGTADRMDSDRERGRVDAGAGERSAEAGRGGFSGAERPEFDRAASERGEMSRGGFSGGGMRGGGGRRR